MKLLLITLLSGIVLNASAQERAPLATYRWNNRPLLVFAPAGDHPGYREQLRRVRAEQTGFKERDMVLVEVIGDGADARALRARFRVKRESFTVILVGKDGTAKDRWVEPVPMGEVFRLIDGMPMRQREMRGARG